MQRRAFLAGMVAVMPLSLPGVVLGAGMRRVGLLFQGESSAPIIVSVRDAAILGLRDEGYIDGRNITMTF